MNYISLNDITVLSLFVINMRRPDQEAANGRLHRRDPGIVFLTAIYKVAIERRAINSLPFLIMSLGIFVNRICLVTPVTGYAVVDIIPALQHDSAL